MIVRQDDTLVCEECYREEGGDAVYRPPAREYFMPIDHGTCECCGHTEQEDPSHE